VHDDNCWMMGGVAGHAGLFGHLSAVHEAVCSWMNAIKGSEDHGLGISTGLIRKSVDHGWMHAEGSRVLGWDTPSPGASTSGRFFGPESIGHLGFTGTSVWMDPQEEVVITLLTNRVCPSRENWGIRRLRPALHDAAWEWAKLNMPA
jgi:CubicO group peptidase (beta-lactamase class C family)